MKTIVLIRHAKSSWIHDVTDIQRPLSPRGENDANLLANEFIKYRFNPEIIFSSPANRALSTCNIFIKTLNYSPNLLNITEELYDFGGQQVTRFLHGLDDKYKQVIIFGHNHAFTAVVNSFGDKFIDNVPTCGLVMLQFESDSWKNIKRGHTELTLFPKQFKS